jgi:hypothetical protein
MNVPLTKVRTQALAVAVSLALVFGLSSCSSSPTWPVKNGLADYYLVGVAVAPS